MGVKLRVRVDGASHRIEVPEVCTLGQLRAAVASKVLADAWPASAVGLSLNGDASELLPVPDQLFNGSLLLGSVSRLFLGEEAQTAKGVLVHPLFIAGWCATKNETNARLSFLFLFLFPSRRFHRSRAACFVRGRPDTDFPDGRRRCRVAAVRRFFFKKKRKSDGSGARLPAPRGGTLP